MATKVTCDLCGSDKNVKAPWATVWNGNTFDLCVLCAKPLVTVLDEIHVKRAQWAQRND